MNTKTSDGQIGGAIGEMIERVRVNRGVNAMRCLDSTTETMVAVLKQHVEMHGYAGTAARIDVSEQTVRRWVKGTAFPARYEVAGVLAILCGYAGVRCG